VPGDIRSGYGPGYGICGAVESGGEAHELALAAAAEIGAGAGQLRLDGSGADEPPLRPPGPRMLARCPGRTSFAAGAAGDQ
jgi:hypothetical protein